MRALGDSGKRVGNTLFAVLSLIAVACVPDPSAQLALKDSPNASLADCEDPGSTEFCLCADEQCGLKECLPNGRFSDCSCDPPENGAEHLNVGQLVNEINGLGTTWTAVASPIAHMSVPRLQDMLSFKTPISAPVRL